jgi:translation elongation factor aEF-1 beta
MGQVAVTLRIIPKQRADINKIKELVGTNPKVKEVKIEGIGFGLSVLKALALIPDATGGTEPLEKELTEINGVERVEVVDVSLI